MTLTRANTELILIKRLGSLLSAAGKDGTTVNGTNADLNDPIGWAIRQTGGTVASVASVADSDIGTIGGDDYDQLFDMAELRALENISGNLTQVDVTMGDRTDKFGQLADMVEKRIDRLRKQIERDYGVGIGILQGGVITLDFMQKGATDDAA